MKKTKNYICSSCGMRGHNKRTCTKTTTKRITSPSKPIKGTPSSRAVTVNSEMTKKNILQAWENTFPHGDERESVGNDNGSYSLEELETLWFLKDGGEGKMGKGKNLYYGPNQVWTKESNEKLIEVVHIAEKTPPGTSPTVWYKFFKNFGAKAKEDLILAHRKADRSKTWYEIERMTGTEYEEIVIKDDPNKSSLPLKLYPALLKDTSSSVRCALAKTSGIPKPVQKLLAQDSNLEVVQNLLSNNEVSGDVVVYVENRIRFAAEARNDSDKEMVKIEPWLKLPSHKKNHEFDRMCNLMVTNPNTPKEILDKYFNNEGFMSKHQNEKMIYLNKKITPHQLEQRYEEISRELKVLRNKAEEEAGENLSTPRHKYFVTKLRIAISDAEVKLNTIIGSGRCDSRLVVSHVKRVLHSKSLTDGQLSRGIAISSLSSEEIVTLYESYEENYQDGNTDIDFGFAANKSTPRKVLKDLERKYTDASNVTYQHSNWERRRVVEIVKKRLAENRGGVPPITVAMFFLPQV